MERQYPAFWFKHLHAPQQSMNPKTDRLLEDDGWTDNPRNIPKQEFPKAMWKPDGTQVNVGNYGRPERTTLQARDSNTSMEIQDRVIDYDAAKAEEARMLAQGYLSKRPDVTVKVQVAAEPRKHLADSRVDDMETRIGLLEESNQEILALLKQLTSKGRKKPDLEPVEA